nr:magnetosome protein Mad22 [Desulfobacteraceae bacterium]
MEAKMTVSQPHVAKNQNFQHLFVEIGDRLENMKTRQIIRTEIIKLSNEIKYFEEKIDETQHHLKRTLSDIDLMQQKIVEPEKELQQLMGEKKQIEKDNKDISTIEKQIAAKLLLLPDIKSKMKILRQDFESYQATYFKIKGTYDDLVAENDQIEKEITDNKNKMSALSSEIAVMKSTRDLLKGLLPDNFDKATYDEIQVNQEETLKQYIRDMNNNMESINADIVRLKNETDTMKKQVDPLQQTVKENQAKISQLTEKVGDNPDTQAFIDQCDHLKHQLKILPEKIAQMKKECKAFDINSQDLDNQIKIEESANVKLDDRIDYLLKRKNQMDAVADMEKEVQRLQTDIQNFQKKTAIHHRVGLLTQKTYDDLLTSKDHIQAQVNQFMAPLTQFEQKVESLIG